MAGHARYLGGQNSRGQREKVINDVRSSISKLCKARQAIIELTKLNVWGVESAEVLELHEYRDLVEERMTRHLAFEADVKRTPASDAAVLRDKIKTSAEQARADALAFLTSSLAALARKMEATDAAVELLVARVGKGGTDADEQEDVVRLMELNEAREWHVERLEKVERMLTNEETTTDLVLDLQDAVEAFIEDAEEEGFESEPTLYNAFGLDVADEEPEPAALPAVSPLASVAPPLPVTQLKDATSEKTKKGAVKGGKKADRAAKRKGASAPSPVKKSQSTPAPATKPKSQAAQSTKTSWAKVASVDAWSTSQTTANGVPAGAATTLCPWLEKYGNCYRSDCFHLHPDNLIASRGKTSFVDIVVQNGSNKCAQPQVKVERLAAEEESAHAQTLSDETVAHMSPDRQWWTEEAIASSPETTTSMQAFEVDSDDSSEATSASAAGAWLASPEDNVFRQPPPGLGLPVVAAQEDVYGKPQLPATRAAPAASASSAVCLPSVAPPAPISPAVGVIGRPSPVVRGPTGLLPLGLNACLNHFIAGGCLNNPCLSRHTVGPEDVAAGLLPFLGPGACLNFFLTGSCLTGLACQLSEIDYAAPIPQIAAAATTPCAEHSQVASQADLVHVQPSITQASSLFNPWGELDKALGQAAHVELTQNYFKRQTVTPERPSTAIRRTFSDPRMKDARFRAKVCRFYLHGPCPFEDGCFDIHPEGAMDVAL